MSFVAPVEFEQAEVEHVCRLPPATPSPSLTRIACVPVVRVVTDLTTKPYTVPAVSVGGVLKLKVMNPPEPLEVPATVDEARSPPAVITMFPALVVLTSTVRFGFVPEQEAQKMLTSSFCSVPVVTGVKVSPARLVLLKPTPAVV